MNTIKVSVKSAKDANLLIRLLKSLSFVSQVEQIKDEHTNRQTDQYHQLQRMIEKIKDQQLFKELDDPVKWQKEQRDEWS